MVALVIQAHLPHQPTRLLNLTLTQQKTPRSPLPVSSQPKSMPSASPWCKARGKADRSWGGPLAAQVGSKGTGIWPGRLRAKDSAMPTWPAGSVMHIRMVVAGPWQWSLPLR